MGKRFTEKQKAKAIKMAGGGTAIADVAYEMDCSPTAVHNWIAQDEGWESIKEKRAAMPKGANGRSDARLLAERKTPKQPTNGLPTTTAKVRSVKSKALLATSFACPHCGGAINAPEQAVAR